MPMFEQTARAKHQRPPASEQQHYELQPKHARQFLMLRRRHNKSPLEGTRQALCEVKT